MQVKPRIEYRDRAVFGFNITWVLNRVALGQCDRLRVYGQPVKCRPIERGKTLNLADTSCGVKNLGEARHCIGGRKDARTATSLQFGRIGVGGAIGAKKEAFVA